MRYALELTAARQNQLLRGWRRKGNVPEWVWAVDHTDNGSHTTTFGAAVSSARYAKLSSPISVKQFGMAGADFPIDFENLKKDISYSILTSG